MGKKIFENVFLEGKYKDLCHFFDAKLLTDDGWSFDVNRIVLAKKNKYFRALFQNAENNNNITVPSVKGKILDQVLFYVYTKSLELNDEDPGELLIAADYLLVDGLKSLIKQNCMDKLSINNCLSLYTAALKIRDSELQMLIYRYIQTNFQILICNDKVDFHEIDVLKKILLDNNLCVAEERIVWLCIGKWVMIDPQNRIAKLPDLLKCLKIADVDESLADEIIHSDIIFKNSLYANLVQAEQLNKSLSLDILKSAIKSVSNSHCNFQSHRRPKSLHIIIQHGELHDIGRNPFKPVNVELYITYDENVDLWKKLGITKCRPDFVTVIGHKIFILDCNGNRNVIFDAYKSKWSKMTDTRINHMYCCAVSLGDNIFVLGGKDDKCLTSMCVEFYNTQTSMWCDAMPMIPVYDFGAVSYQNKIYVVGVSITSDVSPRVMMAQKYDPDLNQWSSFAPPNIFREYPVLKEYHGKIYIIRGSTLRCLITKVEVFDFVSGSWNVIPDYPNFKYPQSIIFNDQLIVYDSYPYKNHDAMTLSPVRWNEEERLWEKIDEWMLPKDLNSYLIYSIKKDDEIRAMLKIVRHPSTTFEKTHFN